MRARRARSATGSCSSTPTARRPPDLLDAYFAEPVGDRVGALAGPILHAPGQRSLAARYARARNFVVIPEQPGAIPTAPTGNLLVRRAAFEPSAASSRESARAATSTSAAASRRPAIRSSCGPGRRWPTRIRRRCAATCDRRPLRGGRALARRALSGDRAALAAAAGAGPRGPRRGCAVGARRRRRGGVSAARRASLVAHNVGYRREQCGASVRAG